MDKTRPPDDIPGRPDLDAIEALAATTTRTFTYDDGITDDSHEPPERGKPMAIYTDTGDWVADFDTGMLPNEELDTIGRLLVGAANALPALVAYARELEATLANERGEGEPPVEGFVFIGNGGERSTWQREVGTVGAYVTREITNLGEVRWAWRIIEDRYGTDESPRFCTYASGAESTARAAMRAASVPA